ncbi:MAG TPA: hypothetical protein VGT78_01215 [Rhizomicrobium sp.]|nr:hypothetical protein [Rhizomicrobium sp.]
MDQRAKPEPGDYILDRYMPNASPAEREAARANLYAFAAAILRTCTRIAQEREAIREKETRV